MTQDLASPLARSGEITVAELTLALILALDRRVPDNVADLRAGRWNKQEYSKARGLYGRTLGLVGVGQIGREMIPRAKGFGMRVVGWSRHLTESAAAEKASSKRPPQSATSGCLNLLVVFEERCGCGARLLDALVQGIDLASDRGLTA